ncbi:4-hydroxybenzoate 3-monooxygenase [uncultured Castellaniella sp.]|uniref:4-hydroxybenzoate 3-monooxygenase n=1 Tax=uncultured Castellaniella sp. TaxID=647907 RepID=UPI0026314040|nr:4-hydroxybenzoate 3-monooxygenase [uncultured Castellaniella sp.]
MEETRRTQVVIIGAGPSGLLLGQLLHRHGIDHVILENRSADYVLGRVRAGVLEQPTIAALREAGVGDRAEREGLRMNGFDLRWDEERCHIDFRRIGKHATVYGQTRVTRDLMDARAACGGITLYEASDVQLHDIESGRPYVTYRHEGRNWRMDCDFIAGCDGFHGVSRQSIPQDTVRQYALTFPFGWLALLADVPPVSEEVAWINHADGFLMCSLRSKTRSRYYVQVPLTEDIREWDADRFWALYRSRLPRDLAEKLVTGPALEMSIAPLRSFVCATMRHGRLFLVGDAAHIVPPTGAKGLNLAVGDAKELADSLRRHYQDHDVQGLDGYCDRALSRIWKAVRFSWWMTNLTHKMMDNPFARQMQLAEFEYTRGSEAAQIAIAENFCGLD